MLKINDIINPSRQEEVHTFPLTEKELFIQLQEKQADVFINSYFDWHLNNAPKKKIQKHYS